MLSIWIIKNREKRKAVSIQIRKPALFGYFILFCIIFSVSTTSPTKAQNPNKIILISTNKDGVPGNNDSGGVSISSDGRFIAYASMADNLIDSDNTNNSFDLFVYDHILDFTVRPAESVILSQISSDGRIITFTKSGRLFTTHTTDVLTGETRNISENFWGYEANGNTRIHSLSFDGRYGTLVTGADNLFPQDSNGKNSDILLYDRVNDRVQTISTVKSGTTGNNASPLSIISDDGRTIAYTTYASDLLGKENSQGIIFYDRILGDTSVISFPVLANGEQSKITDIDISGNGNKFVYILRQTSPTGDQGLVILVDRRTFVEVEVYRINFEADGIDNQAAGLAISGNGEFLALVYPSDSDSKILSRYDTNSREWTQIDQGLIGSKIDISADGRIIAYNKETDNISQIFIWEENLKESPHFILAGRVTDSTGHPLALVKIEDDKGNMVRTDGEGYFWFNEISPGEITLQAKKEGFEFKPKQLDIDLQSDKQDIAFTYTHKELLEEAAKDIGMPYSRNRGEIGPFHGFNAGYCTDLILDAFTWGVDFNIQFALEMEFKANPWHLYRWRDARDAQDMWRFFSYTGQIQNHESDYQPGDVVFFDWSEDGEIDHVALISEVNSRNRPEMMFDATGKIKSNPSGLTAELPWEGFHDKTVRGFARWSGKYQSIIPEFPPGEVLQSSLGGAGLIFRFLDESGLLISETENEIDGGRFEDWIWEQLISVSKPYLIEKYFLVVISNPEDFEQPFSYTTQFIQDGLVKDRIEFKEILASRQIIRIPIRLNYDIETGTSLELGNTNQRIEGSLNLGKN